MCMVFKRKDKSNGRSSWHISISYGIAAGFIMYCIVKVCKGKIKEIHPILWVCTALFILNFVLLALL